MRNSNTPPIIVIGMHRSGTTMITRLLERAGLFMGKNKQGDDEAEFFLNINAWLFRSASAEWDNPLLFANLLNESRARAIYEDYLSTIVHTRHIASFLGLRNYIKYRNLQSLDFRWGWKDPRNTFTLPLWLKVFPTAKVLHIYRNGVDVASSLVVRAKKEIISAEELHQKRKKFGLYNLSQKTKPFSGTLRGTSLENAFGLWAEYVNQAKLVMNSIENEKMTLCYEDFLGSPSESLGKVLDFCELKCNENKVAALAREVQQDRAFAYRTDEKLELFFHSVKNNELLRELGYA